MTPTTLGHFNSAQFIQAARAQTYPIVQLGSPPSTSEWVWAAVGIGAIAVGVWAAFHVTLRGTRYAR